MTSLTGSNISHTSDYDAVEAQKNEKSAKCETGCVCRTPCQVKKRNRGLFPATIFSCALISDYLPLTAYLDSKGLEGDMLQRLQSKREIRGCAKN